MLAEDTLTAKEALAFAHRQPVSTMKYANLAPDSLDVALRALNERNAT